MGISRASCRSGSRRSRNLMCPLALGLSSLVLSPLLWVLLVRPWLPLLVVEPYPWLWGLALVALVPALEALQLSFLPLVVLALDILLQNSAYAMDFLL